MSLDNQGLRLDTLRYLCKRISLVQKEYSCPFSLNMTHIPKIFSSFNLRTTYNPNFYALSLSLASLYKCFIQPILGSSLSLTHSHTHNLSLSFRSSLITHFSILWKPFSILHVHNLLYRIITLHIFIQYLHRHQYQTSLYSYLVCVIYIG